MSIYLILVLLGVAIIAFLPVVAIFACTTFNRRD